jgi:WD40 repeat protein
MRKLLLCALLLAAACVPDLSQGPPATGFAPILRDAPTGTPVAWVESETAITLENADRLARLGRLDAPEAPSTVFAYAFSPDGARLAGLNNTHLIAWNLLSGERVFYTDRADALNVYYAPDKDEIYTLDADGTLRIYNADTGALKEEINGHPLFGGAAAYDAENGLLALGASNGEIKVWDAAARQALATIKAHGAPVVALAFAPDGELLASGGQDGRVTVWDWRNRERAADLETLAGRLVFSPDAVQLAAATTAQVELWDWKAGARKRILQTGVGGAADVLKYAPDGSYLISGGRAPSASLWNPQTGDLVVSLPGVGGDTTSADFSPDGGLLVTAVLGQPVSLWNLAQVSADTLARANLETGAQVFEAAWTPDGFLLALFETAGPVQIWGIPPNESGG